MTFNAVTFKSSTFTLRGSECTNKPWGQMSKSAPENRNSYRIKVICSDTQYTYTVFDYWCSKAHPKLTDRELATAFKCFVDDAIAGGMTFDKFVDEFGYDEPKLAYHTWKACQNANEKMKRIWGGDLYDLMNFLIQQEKNDWKDFINH